MIITVLIQAEPAPVNSKGTEGGRICPHKTKLEQKYFVWEFFFFSFQRNGNPTSFGRSGPFIYAIASLYSQSSR